MVQDSCGRGDDGADVRESSELGGFDALFLADSLDESRQLYRYGSPASSSNSLRSLMQIADLKHKRTNRDSISSYFLRTTKIRVGTKDKRIIFYVIKLQFLKIQGHSFFFYLSTL